MAAVKLYGTSFVNGDGEALVFGHEDQAQEGIVVMGRTGSWSSPPFAPVLDQSATGAFRAVLAMEFSEGVFSLPVGIRAPQGWEIMDWVDAINDVLRPMLDEDTPNEGLLYFTRNEGLAVPDAWRCRVYPQPLEIDEGAAAGNRRRVGHYQAALRFGALESSWEGDPVYRDDFVVKAAGAAAWTTHTFTESLPAKANAPVEPVWEIDGPANGTIAGITIAHNGSGKAIELSGLALATGQTLTIDCREGFLDIRVAAPRDTWPRRSLASDFFPLRRGANSITIAKAASSQSAVRLSYRIRRWSAF